MTPLSLTERDLQILEELCTLRVVPFSRLVRHFRQHPFTGAPNRSPEKACERRLAALAAAGFVLRYPDPAPVAPAAPAAGAADTPVSDNRRRPRGAPRGLVALGPAAPRAIGE